MAALEKLRIDLAVMIRPRGGDFCYSESELSIMEFDITVAKQIGVKTIVTGVLSPDGSVNKTAMKRLITAADGMKVVFHRAFDMTRSHTEALEDLIEIGCCRVLTSGGSQSALAGLEILKNMAIQAKGRIEVMPGSGINPQNISLFLNKGFAALHLSGINIIDGKMKFKNSNVRMTGIPLINEYSVVMNSYEKIKTVVDFIQSKQKV
jgi:copper homeostasis protein